MNTFYVCQHCPATFAMFSNLRMHTAYVHGVVLEPCPCLAGSNRLPIDGSDKQGDTIGDKKLDMIKRKLNEMDMNQPSDLNVIDHHSGTHDDKTAVMNKRKASNCEADNGDPKMKRKRAYSDRMLVSGNDQFKFQSQKHERGPLTRASKHSQAKIGPHDCKTLETPFPRIHTGHRRYTCGVCKTTFQRANDLDWHELMHTLHRRHVCNVCEETFKTPYDLRMHERLHTADGGYACDVCKKSFKRASDVLNHKRIHTRDTGDRPFTCKLCEKAFKRPHTLKIHKGIRHTITHAGRRALSL